LKDEEDVMRGEQRRRRREGQTLPTNGNAFTIAVGD
jgi:hypothetical protein